MSTLFTKIANGEIPGRFVWKDEKCFSILTINPIQPGHCLVIPRAEIDHWLDVPEELQSHLFGVANAIGQAQMRAFKPEKVGLTILGLEVRHVHLHLIPIREPEHMEFARADKNPEPKALDSAAEKLRAALWELGCKQVAN